MQLLSPIVYSTRISVLMTSWFPFFNQNEFWERFYYLHSIKHMFLHKTTYSYGSQIKLLIYTSRDSSSQIQSPACSWENYSHCIFYFKCQALLLNKTMNTLTNVLHPSPSPFITQASSSLSMSLCFAPFFPHLYPQLGLADSLHLWLPAALHQVQVTLLTLTVYSPAAALLHPQRALLGFLHVMQSSNRILLQLHVLHPPWLLFFGG